jgi:hypothetical protein
MKLDAADLKRLKWAFILLALLSALGGATVFGAQLMQKDADKKNREAATARKDIQTRLTRARDEEQELREKISRYQDLTTHGYVGNEMRLDWIETIARIKATRRIQKLDYEFAPQRPADAATLPGGASGGGYDFMSSQLKIQMELLHEDDLFNVIADLRREVKAIIQVRSCAIERVATEAAQRSNSAQLKTECTLEWITLKEKK